MQTTCQAVNDEELQDALQQWNNTVKRPQMNLESKEDRNTEEDTNIYAAASTAESRGIMSDRNLKK